MEPVTIQRQLKINKFRRFIVTPFSGKIIEIKRTFGEWSIKKFDYILYFHKKTFICTIFNFNFSYSLWTCSKPVWSSVFSSWCFDFDSFSSESSNSWTPIILFSSIKIPTVTTKTHIRDSNGNFGSEKVDPKKKVCCPH